MPRRKGTPRTLNSRPLRPGEALDARACTPPRLGMSACDSRYCTTATIAVAALERLRSGLRRPRRSPLRREVLKPASGLQHPEHKTGARKLFSVD